MQTRRQFGISAAAALGGLAATRAHAFDAPASTPDTVRGVTLGLESYGLMPYPQTGVIDLLIQTVKSLGLRRISLQEFLLLPPEVRTVVDASGGPDRGSRYANDPEFAPKIQLAESTLKQWREHISFDELRAVRRKFDAAGLQLSGYMPNNLRVPVNSTDADLERACEIAAALGVHYLAVMMQKSDAKRFVPIAEKHRMKVGLHGHPSMHPTNPDVIATPEDYVEAVSWSKNYGMHFDIGNAAAGGYDAPTFIRKNLEHLSGLVVKDRATNAVSKPWGQGDSHVREILQIVRDGKPDIPCWVDVDIPVSSGRTRIQDIEQCTAYARESLRS